VFQILIVEDDKELSQLFQKVLEKNGYQVKSASDGALALEILDKEYIDLIISDIMMPVMDGYELVSELRSAGYQIPVLMITAKGSFDDMRQGFLSGRIYLFPSAIKYLSCILPIIFHGFNGLALLYSLISTFSWEDNP
jgi:DNA-binding response OmpR family regulator